MLINVKMKKTYLYLILVIFCFPTKVTAGKASFTDTDWTNGNYYSILNIDPDNSAGEILLKNDPADMVYLGCPARLPLITDMEVYKGKLLLLACTDPMAKSDAEFCSYDPVNNIYEDIDYYNKSEGISNILVEQGTHIMRIYNGKVYFAGYDPDDGGNGTIYIYDGDTLIKKHNVPHVAHGCDVACFQGKLYTSSVAKTDSNPIEESSDEGETWQPMNIPPDMNRSSIGAGYMWVYDDKLYVNGCTTKEEDYFYESALFVYDGAAWQTLLLGITSKPYIEFLQIFFMMNLYSTDGINFVGNDFPASYHAIDYTIYDTMLYAALSNYNNISLYMSTDGTTWESLGENASFPHRYNSGWLANYRGRLFEAFGVYKGSHGQAEIHVSSSAPSGYLISTAHPFDPFNEATISWNAEKPPGTEIKFQIRTAKSQPELSCDSFIGPDGSTESYFETSGDSLTGINDDSWIQYKVYLLTSYPAQTPYMNDVTISVNSTSAGLCKSDFNGDSKVDNFDLEIFSVNFGRIDCGGNCEGDFNGDFDIGGKDLAEFASDFGQTDCP